MGSSAASCRFESSGTVTEPEITPDFSKLVRQQLRDAIRGPDPRTACAIFFAELALASGRGRRHAARLR